METTSIYMCSWLGISQRKLGIGLLTRYRSGNRAEPITERKCYLLYCYEPYWRTVFCTVHVRVTNFSLSKSLHLFFHQLLRNLP